MTEKERIILRHTELAKEYSDLAKTDHALPVEVWKKIKARQKEILKEIDELKEIEKKWKK